MPWWSKVANVFRRDQHVHDLEEEMEFHLAMRSEARQCEGLSPEDAHRAAQREFGNPLLTRERARDADIAQWLDTLAQDLRFATRTLAKTPGLTAIVVLSLALGIGANTALFSITNAILLRTLPVADPQRLYALQLGENDTATNPIWEDFRDHQDLFSSVFAWSSETFDTSEGGEVRPVAGTYASGALFRTLGIEPALGRALNEEDDKPGGGEAGPVAILSHAYWQRAYGADPQAIGRTIRLDGKPFRIVGVAPEGFSGIVVGERFDVLLPLGAEPYLRGPESVMRQRSYWWLAVIGRLKPELTLQQAQARVQGIGSGVMERTRPSDRKPQILRSYLDRVFSLVSAARGLAYAQAGIRTPMLILNVVVILVLLIACANVANLLLARSASRRREIAVRIALGASRARIARQLLTESLLLSLSGGLLGLAIAPSAAQLLVWSAATRRSELFLDLHLDSTVLLFTTAVALLCGLLFGAAPAWRCSQVQPQTALHAASGAAGDRRGRLRVTLVGLQVALSLVLLVGAGLFLSTLRNLVRTDLGFQPEGVLLADVDLSRSGVAEQARAAFYSELLDRFRALPGIQAASASIVTPLAGNTWQFNVRAEAGNGTFTSVHAHFNGVSSGFFQTLGTPLLAGRDFNSADTANSALVAVVNETFVRRAFAADSVSHAGNASAALGRRFRREYRSSGSGPAFEKTVEIVGVIKDAKYRTIRGDVPPTVYMAIAQEPLGRSALSFELRSSLGLPAMAPALRAAIAEANPRVTYTARTFSSQARDAMRMERLVAAFSSIFGSLALLLASIGLYGVLSYAVTQRRGEIGIRVALGATPANIRGWVVRQSLWTVLGGAIAGLVLAAWGGALVQSILYGVKPGDPLVFLAGLAVLLLIAALAAYLPARRATRLDPVQALRHE